MGEENKEVKEGRKQRSTCRVRGEERGSCGEKMKGKKKIWERRRQ